MMNFECEFQPVFTYPSTLQYNRYVMVVEQFIMRGSGIWTNSDFLLTAQLEYLSGTLVNVLLEYSETSPNRYFGTQPFFAVI